MHTDIVFDAMHLSSVENRIVVLPASEDVRLELLVQCDDHDDAGLYWGDGWTVRLEE